MPFAGAEKIVYSREIFTIRIYGLDFKHALYRHTTIDKNQIYEETCNIVCTNIG